MIDRIEYGLNETGLQISTTKKIVHAVTARRGAMLDEMRRPADRQVHQRLPMGSEGMVVNFDFRQLGMSMVSGRNAANAERVFGLLQQFEDVVAMEGWQDSRVQSSLTDGFHSRYLIDVERPRGTDGEVEKKISLAMARCASLLRWNWSLANSQGRFGVIYDTQAGVSLRTGRPGPSEPTLSTRETGYSPEDERIRLEGLRQFSSSDREEAFARLICFAGIVATLRKSDPSDTLAE